MQNLINKIKNEIQWLTSSGQEIALATTLAICDNEIERFEEEISAYEKNEIDYENNKNSKLVGKPNFGYVYALHLQLTYWKEQRALIVKE